MTGERFETVFCQLLGKCGFWALKIPRDARGSQPFDVIAIRGSQILAIDCKVSAAKRFPLSRIEDNQWLAFERIHQKTDAAIGVAVCFDGAVYFIGYDRLLNADKSVLISDDDLIFTAGEVDECLR